MPPSTAVRSLALRMRRMRGGDGFAKVRKWGPAAVAAVVVGGARRDAYIRTRQRGRHRPRPPYSGTLLDLPLVRRFGRRLTSSSSRAEHGVKEEEGRTNGYYRVDRKELERCKIITCDGADENGLSALPAMMVVRVNAGGMPPRTPRKVFWRMSRNILGDQPLRSGCCMYGSSS